MKNSTSALILTSLIALCTLMSTYTKSGAIQGINLCLEIIIPSLLPILILTNTINKSSAGVFFEKIFAWFVSRVLKLPKESTSALVLGLIGGYPTGAILTYNLYSKGVITKSQANRIMSFNFSGGIAFIITAVGEICLSSRKIGIILYCSNLLSSIIIAVIGGIFSKKDTINKNNTYKYLNFSDALVESVESTIKSLSVMCCYIIFVSAFLNIFEISSIIKPLIEITNGLCTNSQIFSISQYAGFLSFGGVCIHIQLLGFFKKMGVNIWNFLMFRIISALISVGLIILYLHFFPQTVEVFGNVAKGVEISANQINTSYSAIMIIGCGILIFDIEGKKLKLT